QPALQSARGNQIGQEVNRDVAFVGHGAISQSSPRWRRGKAAAKPWSTFRRDHHTSGGKIGTGELPAALAFLASTRIMSQRKGCPPGPPQRAGEPPFPATHGSWPTSSPAPTPPARTCSRPPRSRGRRPYAAH